MTADTRQQAEATTDWPELALTVVRYTDGPDRCTIYPPEAAGDRRMSTWLSADRSVFVDLEAVR